MEFLTLAAFGGGLVSGLLGFFESGESFSGRKFLPTVLRSAIASGVVAFSYPFIELGFWPGIVAAALAGAGVDVLGHRLAGSIGK